MKPARNYPLLLASQFWGAFGDNFILVVILGPIMNQFRDGKISAQTQSFENIYYTSLLFVPYVLLAPVAGYLNDRFAKNRWLLGGNLPPGATRERISLTASTASGAASATVRRKFCNDSR